MSSFRTLLAAVFLPLFALNLALLAAVGSTCNSCKPKRVSVSQCAAEQQECSARH